MGKTHDTFAHLDAGTPIWFTLAARAPGADTRSSRHDHETTCDLHLLFRWPAKRMSPMQRNIRMKVRTYTIEDASFERSPDQDSDVFTANLVDERHDAPVTIGYGRYGPNQGLTEKMAVDDVMIVLEGSISITANDMTKTARAGGIVHMPKGETVTIKANEEGAVTAYVTYPHWREAR